MRRYAFSQYHGFSKCKNFGNQFRQNLLFYGPSLLQKVSFIICDPFQQNLLYGPLLQVTGLLSMTILFSHEHAAVFSRQEVQYNRIAMTQPLLIMLYVQIKNQWYKYSIVQNELSDVALMY